MKKTKQIAAIVALLCIAALIIGFIISGFSSKVFIVTKYMSLGIDVPCS